MSENKIEEKIEVIPDKTAYRVPQYNPQQEYFNRMNSTQQRRYSDRQKHQFADSIGGCSSNYRF